MSRMLARLDSVLARLDNAERGVLAVLPWCIFDLWRLRAELPFAQVVLAVLLGVGVGSLLGLGLGAIRPRPLQVLLALLPVPLWFWRDIAWALDRGQSLAPWILANAAVVVIAVSVGVAAGLACRRLLQHSDKLSSWSRVGGTAFGGFVTLVLLAPLQSYQAQLAGIAPVGMAVCAVVVLAFWPPARLLAAVSLPVLFYVLSKVPERYEELRIIMAALLVGMSFVAMTTPKITKTHLVLGPTIAATAGIVCIGAAAVMSYYSAWPHNPPTSRPTLGDTLALGLQRLSDLDADGFSLFRGPLDCDPSHRAISPGAHELPGNTADENCMGGAAEAAHGWLSRHEAQNAPPPAHRGDVVFIVIDTLRYDSAASPALRFFPMLRQRGVWFEQAYSTSSSTFLALQGLLAGKLPTSTPLRFVGKVRAGPTRPVNDLVPWMKQAGYRTIYVGMGMDPNSYQGGADELHELPNSVPPGEFVDVAFEAYRRANGPRFLWLHMMWVHDARGGRQPYERAVGEVDHALLRLYDRIGPEALWITTSDHGEEFGEHGGEYHAATLFNEVVHVPLVVAGAGLPHGTITHTTSTRSIYATLAAMVAAEKAGPGPYLCLSASAACSAMPVPMALEMPGVHIHGLISGRYKTLRDVTHGRLFAFDRLVDPSEKHPIEPPASQRQELESWEENAFHADPLPAWPYP